MAQIRLLSLKISMQIDYSIQRTVDKYLTYYTTLYLNTKSLYPLLYYLVLI